MFTKGGDMLIKINSFEINKPYHIRRKYVENIYKPEAQINNAIFEKEGKNKKMVEVEYDIESANNNKVIIADEFENLTNEQTIWFWLYNSNHYDKKFGGSTYLDAVLCYLIAFCNEAKVREFGFFVKGKKDFKGNNLVEQYTSPDRYKNFVFHNAGTYAKCRALAEKVARNKNVMSCIKSLAKGTLEDPDYMKAKCVMAVQELAEHGESEKTKLEAYKLLGSWLGIDKPQVTNNITIQMNAIESDLRRQGFNVDMGDVIEGEEDE